VSLNQIPSLLQCLERVKDLEALLAVFGLLLIVSLALNAVMWITRRRWR
jgi:hypothetical protein